MGIWFFSVILLNNSWGLFFSFGQFDGYIRNKKRRFSCIFIFYKDIVFIYKNLSISYYKPIIIILPLLKNTKSLVALFVFPQQFSKSDPFLVNHTRKWLCPALREFAVRGAPRNSRGFINSEQLFVINLPLFFRTFIRIINKELIGSSA